MSGVINVRFQIAGHTAAEWAAITTIPLAREVCAETDTQRFKVGDGSSLYSALPYVVGAVSWGGITGTLSAQTDLQAALDAKAPLASPALTGTPAAPTAAPGTNTTQISTTAFVAAALAALINSAPGALDTLDELAAAFGDDPNFAATMATALAGKQPLDSDLTSIAALATTSWGRALLALADAAALRAAAGLGTAAEKNIGTSGNTVPVLDGATPTFANGAIFGNTATLLRIYYSASYSGIFNGATLGAAQAVYMGGGEIYLSIAGVNIAWVAAATGLNATAFRTAGEMRCATLRINATPTAETPTPTHTVPISINGTVYRFPCLV